MSKSIYQAQSRESIWPLIVAFTVIYVFISWQVGVLVYDTRVKELHDEGAHQLNLYVQHLRGELEKYEFLPEVFSTDERLVHMLKHPKDPNRVQSLNQYLEKVNSVIRAADTYLMDTEGFTIAASNWQSDRPFVGRNFGYRPYFQEAMQGKLGRYFALGTTSLKRGYYFAYPVRDENKILGAVVIKVDLTELENQWSRKSREVVVTDPDGVIFITTQPDWRFRTFSALPDDDLKRIKGSKRYLDSSLAPLPLKRQLFRDQETRIWQFGDAPDNQEDADSEYLVQEHKMSEAGWEVLLLTPLKPVNDGWWSILGIAGLGYLAMVLMALFLNQRRKRAYERMRYEEYTQEALRQAYDQLEIRVEERTTDLRREIDERRRAETELRQTQKELVQTAKMAVLGQMSTGISHELNQPLAAIRSYADNAHLLLDHGRETDVKANLRKIAELVDRMATIGAQLKQFARKTSGHCVDVGLGDSVAASRAILAPKLRKTGVNLSADIADEEGLQVNADPIQLEQILVNLINNAVNAVEELEDKRVEVHAQALDDQVTVFVRDHGAGIDPDKLEQIFEPFFTTRKKGLGLGLSISQRIARSMGGELSASNHPEGGAVFALQLKRSKPKNNPETSE